MAKIMDSMLPTLSILEYWAIILGFFGGPGSTTAGHGVASWLLPRDSFEDSVDWAVGC